MGYIKDSIQNNIVNPVSRLLLKASGIGQVVSSNEINNTCSILCVDKDGLLSNKDNVEVRLYDAGANWFPAAGDYVIVEDTGEVCYIVARYIVNYNLDIRAKRTISMDISSDNAGKAIGGQIF